MSPLLLGLLLAATWSPGTPLEEAGDDGALRVPAGAAVRVVVEPPGALPRVEDANGARQDLVAVDGDFVVPAAAVRRDLRITLPEGARATVHLESRRNEAVRWERWERDAWAALRRGEAPPEPPAPRRGLVDEQALRLALLHDPEVIALGLLRDMALARPPSSVHLLPAEPLAAPRRGVVVVEARGPALLLVRAVPREEGRYTRATLTVSLDDQAVEQADLAARAGSPRELRVWVPPGAHRVTVRSDDANVELGARLRRLRPTLRGAWPRPARTWGVDEAERRWLTGDLAGALEIWREEVERDSPEAALARVRLVALSPDADEVERLVAVEAWPEGVVGRRLAAAALARAQLLHPERVREALAHLPDPDPQDLARWLDLRSAQRPVGEALLMARGPALLADPQRPRDDLLAQGPELGLATLRPPWSAPRLGLLTEHSPGTPRAMVGAGESATLRLPAAPLGRLAVARLRAEEPATLVLTGPGEPLRLSGQSGRVDVALEPGDWALTVEQGAVVVLDPELVAVGGRPILERPAQRLPATWALPSPGVPVELRLLTRAEGPLLAEFDDGTVRRVEGDRLVAPAGAREVRLLGEGVVALAWRVKRVEEPPLPAVTCAEDPLPVLRALSERAMAGDLDALEQRSDQLACLGLDRSARWDLALSGATDDRLESLLARRLPTAPARGPASGGAALARLGLAEPLPTDPEALEALARRHPSEPMLWVEAARAWREDAERASTGSIAQQWLLTASLAAADNAGPAGADLHAHLLALTRWSLVDGVERSAGLREVVVFDALPEHRSVPARVDRALLALPWPEEELMLLRDDDEEQLRWAPGRAARLELACRSRVAVEGSCALVVAHGGQPEVIDVPIGALRTLELPRSVSEVTLQGPGPDRALAVRLSVDGVVTPPQIHRLAPVAAPGRPIELVVAGPAVLGVEAVGGATLRVTATPLDGQGPAAGPVQVGGDGANDRRDAVLALAGPTPEVSRWRVRIEGDGPALVFRGAPDAVEQALPRPPPPDGAVPTNAELAAWSTALRPEPGPPGEVPGRPGTLLVDLSAGRQQLRSPSEGWPWVGLRVGWAARPEPLWWRTQLWVDGPGVALGAGLEAGRAWRGGWAGGRLVSAWGQDALEAWAGHAGGELFARQDLPLTRTVDLRLSGDLDARWFSPPPLVRVDPLAWTPYDADHPVRLDLQAGLVARVAREARLRAALGLRTNSGPSLDRLRAGVGADLLLADRTTLVSDAALDLRLADAHRAQASPTLRLSSELDQVLYASASNHLRAWARAEVWPIVPGWEVVVGLRLARSDHRGLRDLPPSVDVFRAHLEEP